MEYWLIEVSRELLYYAKNFEKINKEKEINELESKIEKKEKFQPNDILILYHVDHIKAQYEIGIFRVRQIWRDTEGKVVEIDLEKQEFKKKHASSINEKIVKIFIKNFKNYSGVITEEEYLMILEFLSKISSGEMEKITKINECNPMMAENVNRKKILKILSLIIDRCDNALANISKNDLRRQQFIDLAKLAFRFYLVIKSDLPINFDDFKVIHVKETGTFLVKDIKDLINRKIIEEHEIPKPIKSLAEFGYTEIKLDDLKDISEFIKNGLCKLLLVPKNFELNPLFFKDFYESSTDENKIKYNIDEIKKYITTLEQIDPRISKELKEKIDQIEKYWNWVRP